MPKAYCHCCRRETPHKVVMKRSQPVDGSVFQTVHNLVTVIFQGGHYVKMEKQSYCRVCNSRTELTDADFSNAKVS
ncbi:hypothetical protein M9194_09725 [Vibrio sp. S4M6]|uniref:hypothetical protein n=2 Tax=Vibrio sinus TaxID=2946865 RepID=UPI00202AC0A5|nr:hypothetical protein [Vibrio sinus]MCL9781703.1 hypothetical protein [Vibrio sinus]